MSTTAPEDVRACGRCLAPTQLHADPAATEAAPAAASLPARSYDMYDTIAIDSLEDLRGSLIAPEVAAALSEDELGHVDHHASLAARSST